MNKTWLMILLLALLLSLSLAGMTLAAGTTNQGPDSNSTKISTATQTPTKTSTATRTPTKPATATSTPTKTASATQTPTKTATVTRTPSLSVTAPPPLYRMYLPFTVRGFTGASSAVPAPLPLQIFLDLLSEFWINLQSGF